jgi:hypothetical protein
LETQSPGASSVLLLETPKFWYRVSLSGKCRDSYSVVYSIETPGERRYALVRTRNPSEESRLNDVKANEQSKGGEHPLSNGKERSGPELRGHRRISLEVPIECRDGQRTVMGTAVNISLGGVLIRADQTFPWDEAVNFSFALPGSTEILQLKGRIAHVVPGAFMGLEFVELPPSTLERIGQYISAALSAS